MVMFMNGKQRKEWEGLIEKYSDCPEKVFELAKTPWEKAVAVEFFQNSQERKELKNDIKWLKYLIQAVFGVTILVFVAEVCPKILAWIATL